MVKIQNSDAIKAIRDNARLSISEGFPQDLDLKIVPTMDMTPDFHRICDVVKNATAINATSGTIYTTPADQDFYLTGATLSVIKDVTATSLNSSVKVTINGEVRSLLRISSLTTTVQSECMTMDYPTPIKIDRNTNITVENGTNNANISSNGTIVGFVVTA